MASTQVKIIWGGGGMGRYSQETNQDFLNILEKHGVKDIDTAFSYQDSEKALGELGAPEKFVIHTKAPAIAPHSMSKKSILEGVDKQLALLGVASVETYFLHAPDRTTPIEETLEAINIVHKAGKFRHFGLSNYTRTDVQNIYNICKTHGYPLPTVYQGNYNPVARHTESDLFPLLHKLNISFQAYSPLAGGFLVKDISLFTSQGEGPGAGAGRWDKDSFLGKLYRTLYGKPSLLKALQEWSEIAHEAGVSKSALAYRWVVFHSALKGERGDACIVGASRPEQLTETMGDVEAGPLPAEAVERIEALWEKVKDEAPVDNYNSYLGKM